MLMLAAHMTCARQSVFSALFCTICPSLKVFAGDSLWGVNCPRFEIQVFRSINAHNMRGTGSAVHGSLDRDQTGSDGWCHGGAQRANFTQFAQFAREPGRLLVDFELQIRTKCELLDSVFFLFFVHPNVTNALNIFEHMLHPQVRATEMRSSLRKKDFHGRR